jgi:parallel beta-helix repeat protein
MSPLSWYPQYRILIRRILVSVLVVAIFVFSLLHTTPVQAAILHKGGTISADETWTADNVYIIDSDLTIADIATLTIQAGTVVKLWQSAITVYGILDIQGTDTEPVIFTSYLDDDYGGDTNGDGSASSPNVENWGYIQIRNSASTFHHALVRYAFTGIYVENSSPTISDNLLTNNEIAIVILNGSPSIENNQIANNYTAMFIGYASPSIANNNFSDSVIAHLEYYADAHPSYSGNTFSGSGGGIIRVDGGTASGESTWGNVEGMNWPYYLTGTLTIQSGATLHLPAGMVIKSMSGTIFVEGTLDVQGTSADPVVFTSYRDDTYGGDTNKDGAASSPAAGDWYGIQITNSASTFQFSVVRYASTAINLSMFSTATIANNLLTDNGTAVSFSAGSPNLDNNQISNNSTGLYIASASPSVTNNNFSNNGLHLKQSLAANATYSGNTFSGTGGGVIPVSGSTLTGEATWQNVQGMNWPYYISSNITINSGAKLHLAAGAIIKLWHSSIIVNGILDSQGTAGNPVIFTSYRDDGIGGDTNGDGSATTPQALNWGNVDWMGIQIFNSANTLRYVEIHYALDGILTNGSSPGIADSLITHTVRAIEVYNGSPVIENNQISENETSLYIQTGSPTIDNNQISDNSTGLYLQTASPTITNNLFSNNEIHLEYFGSPNPTYEGNTFSGTGGGMIKMDGGEVDGDVTWQNVQGMNWPYYLCGGLTITTGSTLHLPAGTIIKISAGITVAGILDSQGTADNPVIFTSYRDDSIGGDTNGDGSASHPVAGDWGAIQIFNSANHLQFAVIRYAGTAIFLSNSTPTIANNLLANNGFAIQVSSGSPILDNNQISQNSTGLYVSAGSPVVSNNSFSDNGIHLRQSLNGSSIYSGNTFSGTGSGLIQVTGGSLTGAATWQNMQDMGWPYSIIGSLTINSGAALHLAAGTVVKTSGTSIVVNGILDAQGSDANPVVFTSYRDDSYGGDTNGDGGSSSPMKGDWVGIQVGSSATTLKHAIVRYATAAVTVTNSSPTISTNFLTNNSTAITISAGSPILDKNQIINNSTGLYIGNASPTISNNNFSDNGLHLSQSVAASADYSGNSFLGTGGGLIRVTDGILSGTATWQNVQDMGWSYVLQSYSSLTINSGAVLHLQAGAVIKAWSSNIEVLGLLDSQGTKTDPVVITSYRDDASGGDTNGDGAQSSPKAGDWAYIGVHNSLATIQNVIVRYANMGFWVDGAFPTIANDLITDNNTAIRISSGSATISGNTLTHNGTGMDVLDGSPVLLNNLLGDNSVAIHLSSGAPVLKGNQIENNTTALSISGASPAVTNNSFTNNQQHLVYSGAASPTYSGNTFSGTGGGLIQVSGNLSGSATWVNVQGMDWPYKVTSYSNLTINSGAVLHLSAGTVMKAYKGAIVVNGILDAQGTEAAPVVFTSTLDDTYGGDTNADGHNSVPNTTDWGGIQIVNSANTLQNAIIRYAGTAILVSNSSPTISHNFLNNNNGAISVSSGSPTLVGNQINYNSTGLFVGDASPTVTGNSFLSNGVHLSQSVGASPSYSGNTFSGTGGGMIQFGGTLMGTATCQNVQGMDWPYVINGTLVISSGGTLHLPAGTIIKVRGRNYILDDGVLDAQGTDTNPVVFTSYKDDTVGGDTNGDGASSRPAAGDWLYIQVNNSNSNFQYAVIRYASTGIILSGASANISHSLLTKNSTGIHNSSGSPTLSYNQLTDNGTAVSSLSGSPTLSHNLLANNSAAIGVTSGSPLIDGNQITNNTRGLDLATATAIITNNDISNNTDYGVYKSNAPAVIAKNNWWGSASGPYHAALNPSGKGNRISDNIDFSPWMAYPPGNLTVVISGNAGVAGVTINYDLGGLQAVTSGADGSYSIIVSPNWSGIITPTKAGYNFIPESRVVAITNSNLGGQDFTANQIPVLAANLGLSVQQCGQTALAHSMLNVNDDNPPDQLFFTLFALPRYGKLWKNGSELTLSSTFTQADIDSNQVSYIHDCSVHLSDGFVFSVADGAGGRIDATGFIITATPITPALALDVNLSLAVNPSKTATITKAYLHSADPDIPTVMRTFTVTVLPQHGALQKGGAVLNTNDTFTQADIDTGLIVYVQDGSVFSRDQFTFSVSDGLGGMIGPKVFNIENGAYKYHLYLPVITK